MAIRSLIVKIGAQTQDIDKALADLGIDARKADAELSKLGDHPIAVKARESLEAQSKALKALNADYQAAGAVARNAAAGIEAVGGPAKLAKNDLEALNKTLIKGLDAYRAMGTEAPKELQKMADAVAKQRAAITATTPAIDAAGKSTGLLGTASGLLGQQIAALAGPAALGLAAKKALDYADNLTKLSDRTGIGVVSLQRLEAIAVASGNSIDNIAGAVNRFQKGIVSGDLDEPIRKLGLSVSELRAQAPDEQFISIAKAIQQIKDPAEQAEAAMRLFGKSGAELLPTLKADVDNLADSTFKMSAETVKALDAAGDAFARYKTDTINIIGTIVANILRIPEALALIPKATKDAFENGLFAGMGERAANELEKLGKLTTRGQISGLTQFPPTGAVTPAVRPPANLLALSAAMRPATKEASALAAAMKAARLEIAEAERPIKRLTAAQLEQVRHLHDLNIATATISLTTGIAEKEITAFGLSLDAVRKIESEAATVNPLGGWIALIKPATEDVKGLTKALEAARAIETGGGAIGPLGNMPLTKPEPGDIAKRGGMGAQLGQTFGAANVGQVLTQAFTGGGGVTGAAQALGSQAGLTFTTGLGAAATKSIGGTIGKVVGGVLGPLGGLLGPAVGGLLGKLFGDAEKQVNKMRDAFVKARGGITALAEDARQAGKSVDALLNAKNQKAYEKAVDELTEALDRQAAKHAAVGTAIGSVAEAFQANGARMPAALRETLKSLEQMQGLSEGNRDAIARLAAAAEPNFQTLQARAAEFGVSLEQLGPKFQQANLEARSKAVSDLFGDLVEVGGDAGGILSGLADEFSALVVDAKRFGVALPENLKPMLLNLLEAGKLTDAAGNRLEDLSGVDFEATPLDKSTNAIVDAITKLGELLKNLPAIAAGAAAGMGSALGNVNVPTMKIPIEFVPAGEMAGAAGGGLVTAHGIQSFGAGGRVLPFLRRGTDTVPAMLTPGEIVLNAAQQRGLASALGGGGGAIVNVAVHNNADVTTIANEQRLAQRVGRAVTGEIQKTFKRGR